MAAKHNKIPVPAEVQHFIKECCEEQNVHLIETYLRGNTPRQILEVFIDSENGVTHEDCKIISDIIDAKFEETDFMDSVASVEVSSPGADRPLEYRWQYRKHIDRMLESKLKDGSTVKGKLISVDDHGFTLKLDLTKKEIQEAKKNKMPLERTISFDDVAESRIVLKW